MTTQSTAEAMALLERTRKRFLAEARDIAEGLIGRNLSVNGREVLQDMARRGLISDARDVPDHWAGAIFRERTRFRWTGLWCIPNLATPMTIHDWRPVKLWTGATTLLPKGYRRTMRCPHCKKRIIVQTAMVLED